MQENSSELAELFLASKRGLLEKLDATPQKVIREYLCSVSNMLFPIIGRKSRTAKNSCDYKIKKRLFSRRVKKLKIRTRLHHVEEWDNWDNLGSETVERYEWLVISCMDGKPCSKVKVEGKVKKYDFFMYSLFLKEEERDTVKSVFYKVAECAVSILDNFFGDSCACRFLLMDQCLPLKLDKMEASKRLALTKELEEVLEKEMEIADSDSFGQMRDAKALYLFAKKCGINSERAKELYKQKMREQKTR